MFLICLYHCVYEALSQNWASPSSSRSFPSLIQVTDPANVTATLVLQVSPGSIPANACHLAAIGGREAGS